jgi:hypothetical protein
MSPHFFVLVVIAVFAFFGVTCSGNAQTIAAQVDLVPVETIRLVVPDPYTDYRLIDSVKRSPDGSIARSSRVISAFRKVHPCPVTGLNTGACPGWAIDHVIPLAACGADIVSNMQWLPLTIKSCAGTECKDRWERKYNKCP